ncbi:MAG: FtsX-like permease family protein [Cytophagales bacterium]|nr:MAG: FtsX-like permease family protein [Cytophagales bacterium]TAH29597.1 MAG: FtsX-like permease family protein [Cytophagales bacterium]
MNFKENIKEGLRSVKSNMLRSVLTALIIAIGIMALVGILTAIDSMQASLNSSFAEFGANSFEIQVPQAQRGGGFGGPRKQEKSYPVITYRQAKMYEQNVDFDAKVSISTTVGGTAEVKNGSKKTNPNVLIIGTSENYITNKFLDLAEGRNFSAIEQERGSYSIILGYEVAEKLFDKREAVNQFVSMQGGKYLIVGVLKKAGSSQQGGDRAVLIPLERARVLMTNARPTFTITTLLNNTLDSEEAMGEATLLMRQIRQDKIGKPNSFEISSSESLVERLNNITGYLKFGGYVVGFITLLGASIGLMNIMMVSVTERTREIGVRKALGATPARIRQQFLIEAIIICQIGGVFGVFFGIAMGNFVAISINAGIFVIPWAWIIIAFTVCILVGVISGWYPAYKASKLDPIDALRFE